MSKAKDSVEDLRTVVVDADIGATVLSPMGDGSGLTGIGGDTAERTVYTATASQTTFATTYDVGFVDVYLNGIKLQVTADFSDSSGTSVVLTTGATVGDIVDIIAYGTFNVANTYTPATADAKFLAKTGGEVVGLVNMTDNILERPVLKDYAETKVAMAANDADLSLGNVQTKTISGVATLTFSNPPATGSSGSFTLILTNGGSSAVTWPTSVDWPLATAPTLTAAGVDVLVFTTIDGGTIWYGIAAGIGMA